MLWRSMSEAVKLDTFDGTVFQFMEWAGVGWRKGWTSSAVPQRVVPGSLQMVVEANEVGG